MNPSQQEKLDYIRLARSQNIGPSTFFRLIEIFSSAKKAIENFDDFLASSGAVKKIKLLSNSDAQKELMKVEKFGAEILIFCQEEYPRLLREIPDPPPILTVKGRKELLDQSSIAVVGPRNASFNATAFAKKIAADLAQNSIIVASGLAKGVDAAAHKASVHNGTIAFIAGGIDNIYPPENKNLYQEIFEKGLIVSEQAFSSPPKPANFIQRNRLISGISLGTAVIEAGLKSGSLTTARFALDQGREIYSVPGSPLDVRCLGTNRLIKEGARVLENIDDIMGDFYDIQERFSEVGILREPDFEEFKFPEFKMPSNNEIKDLREEILSKLSFTPISIEDISEEMQISSRLINIALTQLELLDKIEISSNKVYLKSSFS